MTVLEVQFRNHLEASERVHADLTRIANKLDERDDSMDQRIDTLDLRLAWIGGAVGLAVFLATIFGPVIRTVLGLP